MSWSVSMIGKPSAVSAELDRESEKLSGQCKKEFDGALPHLKALLAENFNDPDHSGEPTIQLDASGSGNCVNGVEKSRSCQVSIKPIWTKLV